jgi:hypothetical protein
MHFVCRTQHKFAMINWPLNSNRNNVESVDALFFFLGME